MTTLAHGLVQRANLPIPEWLFAWGAFIVLVVSFVALAVLWNESRLEREEPPEGEPASGFGRALASPPVVVACRVLGVAMLVVLIVAGIAGTQTYTANITPTFIYVIFWVGLVLVSVLLGDVFRAFNPWLALGLAAERLRGGREPRAYPERWGRWPAAIGLIGFTSLELVVLDRIGQDPSTLAWAALAYTVAMVAGCVVFGARTWIDHGEAFGVYFGLFARIAPLEARDGAVRRRPVLSGLTSLDVNAGTVGLLGVLLGTVTFDGLSSGTLWRDTLQPPLFDASEPLFGTDGAEQLAALVGMLACIGIVLGFYRLGIKGAASVGGGMTESRLAGAFVHSLVPIAVVYALAHYLSLLVFDGQYIAFLVSDPLGEGWDLFGTAAVSARADVLSQEMIWYLQVGAVILGHVAALALAHDRALVLYPDAKLAVRSQYWMLAVMVGFTTLALWLLAAGG